MNQFSGWLCQLFGRSRPHAGWLLGIIIMAAIAAYLWIGRDHDNSATEPAAAVASPPEDVLPPADADAEAGPPPDTTGQSGDIIPPEEP